MSIAVRDLEPGDVVEAFPGARALYVTRTPHPLHPGLELVVWRLDTGEWSLDALSADQHVGELVDPPASPDARRDRLRAGIIGAGAWWRA